ncbi:hypothetical protein EI94DRAFT_1700592 [Lactarius quietus]|nr:hypothetical protein EI94DRAFT_1700592 [Lactarius quietus]
MSSQFLTRSYRGESNPIGGHRELCGKMLRIRTTIIDVIYRRPKYRPTNLAFSPKGLNCTSAQVLDFLLKAQLRFSALLKGPWGEWNSRVVHGAPNSASLQIGLCFSTEDYP